MAAAERELYYDPYDYEIDANPHPVWKRMRNEAPLYRNEKHDFYALSRFRDVLDAPIPYRCLNRADLVKDPAYVADLAATGCDRC